MALIALYVTFLLEALGIPSICVYILAFFFQFIIYSYPTGKQKIHECQNFGFFPLTSKDLQLVLANKFN